MNFRKYSVLSLLISTAFLTSDFSETSYAAEADRSVSQEKVRATAEQKEVWNKVKKTTAYKEIRPDLKKLLTPERIELEKNINYDYALYRGDGKLIVLDGSNIVFYRETFTSKDYAEPWEKPTGINPKTKRPFFDIPESIKSELPADKLEYYETLSKVLSENYAALLPIISFDQKKLEKGMYNGEFILPKIFLFGEKPKLEKGLSKIEVSLRRKLGFPLYDPAAFDKTKLSNANNCGVYVMANISTTDYSFPVISSVRKRMKPSSAKHARIVGIETQLTGTRKSMLAFARGIEEIMKKNEITLEMDFNDSSLSPEQRLMGRWYQEAKQRLEAILYSEYLNFNSFDEKTKAAEKVDEDKLESFYKIGEKDIKPLKVSTNKRSKKLSQERRRRQYE